MSRIEKTPSARFRIVPMSRRLRALSIQVTVTSLLLCGCAIPFTHFTPRETRIPEDPVRVRMPVVEDRPYVYITINGRGPYPFMVDTGADGIIVSEGLARELDLQTTGIPSMLAGGVETRWRVLRIANLDSVRIADATFNDVDCLVADLISDRSIPPDNRGLIGFGLFAECLLTLDYPLKTMVISRGELPSVDGRDIVCYDGSLPHVELIGNEKRLHVLLDSGSGGWIDLTNDAAEELEFRVEPRFSTPSLGLNATVMASVGRLAGTLRIGRHTMEEPIVKVGDIVPKVGGAVLKHFKITFDSRRRLVRFERHSTPITFPPIRGIGFVTESIDGRIVVTEVIAGTPAAELDVRVGDRIAALEGQDALRIELKAMRSLLNESESVRVTFERDGESGTFDKAIPVAVYVP